MYFRISESPERLFCSRASLTKSVSSALALSFVGSAGWLVMTQTSDSGARPSNPIPCSRILVSGAVRWQRLFPRGLGDPLLAGQLPHAGLSSEAPCIHHGGSIIRRSHA